MKKLFENPQIEITVFEAEDITNVSGTIQPGGASGTAKAVAYSEIADIFTVV